MTFLKIIGLTLFLGLAASAQAVTLKIATLSPDGSSWMQKFRASAKEIKTLTNNRVKMKYYPGGVMGNDAAVLKKIRIRQLQGGAMTGGSLERYYPDSQIYSMPLKFDKLEQVDHVRKSIDPLIEQGFDKGGFVTFGIAGGGFAYLMSKDAITHPDQLKKQKVWAPSSDTASKASFDAFGVSPIPLSLGDVLAGLQTDLINTIATSPVAAISLQWHTQLKYVTEVPIVYIYAVLAIDKKAFNKLTDGDQNIVREVMSKAFVEFDDETRDDNEKALAALEKQGVKVLRPNRDEMAAWRSKGRIAEDKMLQTGAISKEMAGLLNQKLQAYKDIGS